MKFPEISFKGRQTFCWDLSFLLLWHYNFLIVRHWHIWSTAVVERHSTTMWCDEHVCSSNKDLSAIPFQTWYQEFSAVTFRGSHHQKWDQRRSTCNTLLVGWDFFTLTDMLLLVEVMFLHWWMTQKYQLCYYHPINKLHHKQHLYK